VVLSSHQTEDVAALCESVIVLDQGRVRYDGPVTEPGEQAGRGGGVVNAMLAPARPESASGGTLTIRSQPGQSTTITGRWPTSERTAAAGFRLANPG
jgi:ABC-type uncharacterized transport system ATPase subunit